MIEGQPEPFCDARLHLMHLGAIFGHRLACLGRGQLCRGAMFIGGTEKQNLMAPAAQVWLSDPRRQAPGRPNCSWCTGWLTPLPAWLYQIPKRRQALRRKRWSSAFL